MHQFKIWGPLARRIQLRYGTQTCAMDGPDEIGCWTLTVSDAEVGMDYAFLIDDDPTPYPDPRSLWQPEGVHGVSRLYDTSAFSWTDAHWQPSPLFGGDAGRGLRR